ncbi:expansin EXLX1 family cellulose-binding protein [Streptomyces sp. NPDC093982]|uniref:expansin EXLX1 family cellulose-binding protein n=1 Tax=Streptomyces sp. NPDC093982 TaxID=3155077 RepID=UPI003416EA70
MASPSHRRRSRRKWRAALVPAAVVAAVALAASLLMALRPDGNPTAADAPTAPVSGSPVPGSRSKAPPTAPSRAPKPTPSPSKPSSSPPPATTTAAPRASNSAAASASATAPAAGRIRPGVTYDGIATFYDTGNGDGACLYGPTDDVMTAAMNHADYETSRACGAYVRVRAAGGASVTVRITNECPLPCAPGQLDLSVQAFAKLATPSAGRIPISWSLLSPGAPEAPERISIRYKTGSSSHWCGIQAVGHRNPLARLDVRDGGGWRQLRRTEYNYFLSEQGSGCGGELRLTDIYGERLTLDDLPVRPDVLQPARVQFAAH